MPCDWQWRIRVLCLSIFRVMPVIIISYKMHFAETTSRDHYDRFKPEMETTAHFTHDGSDGASL